MFCTGGGVTSSQQEASRGELSLVVNIPGEEARATSFCTHCQYSHFSKRKVVAISKFTYTGTVLKFLHGSDALVLDMALPMSTVHIHSALHLLLTHSLRTFSSPNRCGVEALSILLLKSLLMIEKCL